MAAEGTRAAVVAAATVAMAPADNRATVGAGNGGGKQKQRQRQGQTTINQRLSAIVAAEMAIG